MLHIAPTLSDNNTTSSLCADGNVIVSFNFMALLEQARASSPDAPDHSNLLHHALCLVTLCLKQALSILPLEDSMPSLT